MKITLRTVLLWAAGLLAIVAFFLTFGAGIIFKGDNTTIEVTGLIFGNQKTITSITLLGKTNVTESVVEAKDAIHSTLSQIGAFMILGGGVLAAALGFSKSKDIKVLACILAVVILVGGIFVLLVKTGFQEATIKEATKDLTSENAIQTIRDATESLYEKYENNTLTIISTILGFASAALAALAGFTKVKKGK